VTHEYTLLLGGTVLPGGGRPACEAIAWADGTILALGSEREIRALSRGDSTVLRAYAAFVAPLHGTLEIGVPADLAIHERDPRRGDPGPPRAVIRAGHVTEGELPVEPFARS
jgi:predicted amidohydrolase YtcJ